jgi:hypothetical protein
MEIAEIFGFSSTRKYAYCTLVVDQYRYSLPPDFNGGQVTLRDTTNNRRVTVWPTHWYDIRFPDPSEETSNEVIVACIKNMELWLAPPPDSTDTLELEYARSGAETTASDFSWLPELMRFRCCALQKPNAQTTARDGRAGVCRRLTYFRSLTHSTINRIRIADGKFYNKTYLGFED